MKIRLTAALMIGLASFAPSLAHAGAEAAGTTAANFLAIGAGPRILGMGGATLGLAGDLNTLGWNAAALGSLPETQFILSHAGLANESKQEYFSTGGRLGPLPTRWAVTGLYQNQGSFEGRDASNNSTGAFVASSMAVGGYLAQTFRRAVSLGIGGKWVNDDLGPTMRGSGFTFDAGLLLRLGMFGLGFSAQNALGEMRYGDRKYPFPTNYGVGAAVDHPSGMRLAVDANFPTAYYSDVRAGLEYKWHDLVALRGGYRTELGAPERDALTGPSFGVSAGAYGLWFDYGYLIPSSADAEHRLGVSFWPGRAAVRDPFSKGTMVGPPMPRN